MKTHWLAVLFWLSAMAVACAQATGPGFDTLQTPADDVNLLHVAPSSQEPDHVSPKPAQGSSIADLAGDTAAAVANRAVDALVPAVSSTIEAIPGGTVLHGLIDEVATGVVKDGQVDWRRAVAAVAGSTALALAVGPECIVGAIVVDVTGGTLGRTVYDSL